MIVLIIFGAHETPFIISIMRDNLVLYWRFCSCFTNTKIPVHRHIRANFSISKHRKFPNILRCPYVKIKVNTHVVYIHPMFTSPTCFGSYWVIIREINIRIYIYIYEYKSNLPSSIHASHIKIIAATDIVLLFCVIHYCWRCTWM